MFAEVPQNNLVPWLDLRTRFCQRVGQLHPLPIHHVRAFPSAQFKVSVILQDKRRGVARVNLPFHLCLRALVAAGYFWGLRVGRRNYHEKQAQAGNCSNETQHTRYPPNQSHETLRARDASLRCFGPVLGYRCKSFASRPFCKPSMINHLRTGRYLYFRSPRNIPSRFSLFKGVFVLARVSHYPTTDRRSHHSPNLER